MDDKNEKKAQVRQVIKCPYCGYEFLPGEVLYPESIIGQPRNIIRDATGKIIYEEYKDDEAPAAEETYICDECGREFVIEIETKYKTRAQDETIDFTSDSTSLI